MSKRNSFPEPWERQIGETSKAYQAFCVYRDMGPDRSLRKVARTLHKSLTIIRDWSVKYNWVERAAEWDAEQDRIIRKENEEARKKMLKVHAELGNALLVKAARGLKNLPDDALTAFDIARLVEVGSKLERLARGESTDNIELHGSVDATVKIYIPDNGRDRDDGEGE